MRSHYSQWQGKTVTLLEAKTGKLRSLTLSDALQAHVTAYRREIQATTHEAFLCPTRRGGRFRGAHVSRSTIFRHFKAAVKLAGLEDKGYTIHSLRKCYAVDTYRQTKSLLAVQKALNHDRLATTMIYLMDLLTVPT